TGNVANNNLSPSPCSGNKVQGTVNGTTVCVDSSAPTGDPHAPVVTTKTNPDGSTSSSNSTTTSVCTGDGSCTTTVSTTTTTTPAGGGTPTTTTDKKVTTDDKPTFCAENPESPMCKSSPFGGSCGGFSCDGDA